MNLTIDVPAFLESLTFMAKGMAGIFIVAGIIVLSTILLNRITSSKE